LIEIDADGPVSLKDVAGDPAVQHHAQAIQAGVPIIAILDPPTDDHLARERGRVAAEIARARGRTTARFHDKAAHAP
jgi:hypothetical protein